MTPLAAWDSARARGKLSKEKEKRDLENKFDYFKKKLELAQSEKEKEELKEAIVWVEKKLESLE